MLLGYTVGAVIGYYIAEMVLQKTWRVFGNIKGLGIYAGVIAFMLAVIQLFGFYENKVPEPGLVKNVLFTETPHVYGHHESFEDFFSPEPVERHDNILAVTKLHEQIARDKKTNEADNSGLYDTAFFLYELKNGSRVIRQYRINKKLYEDYYEPIQESEEYKKASNEIFTIQPEQVKHMTISSSGPAHKSISFSSRDELKELLDIIQEDILAESYADSSYFQGRGSHIEILLNKDHYVVLVFKPTYKKLSSWLEERDLLERARVSSDDLEQIQVAPWEGELYVDPREVAQQLRNSAEVLEVSDRKQVEELLDSAGYSPDHKYIILMKYKGHNYYDALFMDEEHAPEFIRSQFN
jgi:ABC-2 type transport system permease protein